MKTTTRTMSLCAILLLHVGIAQATLIGTESFLTGGNPSAGEYALWNITNQNPSVSGWAGAWSASSGSFTSGVVQASSLAYTGYSAGEGGSLRVSVNSANGRVIRLLDDTYGTDGDVVYFSFLMQLNATGDQYRAFELNAPLSNSDPDRTVQLGTGSIDFTAGNFGLRINNNASIAVDLGAQDTSVNLFVVKLEYHAGVNNDVVQVWRNPDLSGPEPLATGTLTAVNLQNLGVGRMSFARFNSANNATWDEVRIGTTWDAVIPEPSTLLMLLTGGALLLKARRRRLLR